MKYAQQLQDYQILPVSRFIPAGHTVRSYGQALQRMDSEARAEPTTVTETQSQTRSDSESSSSNSSSSKSSCTLMDMVAAIRFELGLDKSMLAADVIVEGNRQLGLKPASAPLLQQARHIFDVVVQ